MPEISYTPTFIRLYKKLPTELREEIKEKIELLKKNPRDPTLKVHKLKGRLKDRLSFSVNFSYRILFQKISKKEVLLLVVGDHSVYK